MSDRPHSGTPFADAATIARPSDDDRFMREALRRTGGVQSHAARLLGMSFRSFRYFAKKHDLGGRADLPEGETVELGRGVEHDG